MKNQFTIPKAIIGLWQIADMERSGNKVDPAIAAKSMMQYYENGFTCFDMADHYGSSEEIAGYCKKHFAPSDIQFFTKWVPSPGVITEKIAGIESTAKSKSVNSITATTTNNGVANFIPFSIVKNLSPEY